MVRLVVASLALLVGSARATPCTRGAYLDTVARAGDGATACVDDHDGTRECWRIDKRGQLSPLPQADWPPAPAKDAPPPDGDHRGPASQRVDSVAITAPDGVTVKVQGEPGAQAIEVCEGKQCRRLVPKQRRNLDEVVEVTVLPDRHDVFVGLGFGIVAPEQLLRFDLAHPDAGRALAKCTTVVDSIGGNVLVQKTDCANAGGPRMLFTPAGKILGVVGESFSSGAPSYAVGGDRWLFYGYNTFAVWDVAKGVQLATVPVCR